jgi:hypothetical protein
LREPVIDVIAGDRVEEAKAGGGIGVDGHAPFIRQRILGIVELAVAGAGGGTRRRSWRIGLHKQNQTVVAMDAISAKTMQALTAAA